ncbi:MAG: hypothetical protein ACRENJ_12490 [Candidatus Eiseniibacteriota bacterium]
MRTLERRRPPISVRHAFGLALDLAIRRDPVHSIVIPLALRAPWILALVLLPPVESADVTAAVLGLTCVALLGDFFTLLVVGAMLRLRARSVYNTPRETRPAPAAECYAKGIRRIPWLIVTEVLRNLVLAVAASLIVLPTAFTRFRTETATADLGRNLLLLVVAAVFALPSLFVVYRLAVATEAVVLDENDLGGAFQRSFKMMRGHLERWFELILVSGIFVLAPAIALAAISLAVPALAGTPSLMLFWLVVVAGWPIVQYAWTFFYLRLVEIQAPVDSAATARPTEPEVAMPAAAAAGSPRLPSGPARRRARAGGGS